MTTDEHSPVGVVLGDGFRILPLPEGWTPLEGVVLVKCLDAEGLPTWSFRTTSGINDEELLGALTVRLELAKKDVVGQYLDLDED